MNNVDEYIYHLIQSHSGIGVGLTRAVFIRAVKDFQTKEIDRDELRQVADKLLNIINNLEQVYEADQELGSLLHDTIEWSGNVENRLQVFTSAEV